jgi:hypothetical protein
MNLFKKIWSKNFLKAKEPIDKFAEDIGGLRGDFSWIKYYKGQKVDSFTYHNDITNLSKSTIIRLLAQGTSNWRGAIVPTNYKITKMRFGNAPYTHGSFDYNNTNELPLCYYDLSEIVYRPNLTNSNTDYSPAGGRYTTTSGNTPAGAISLDSDSDVSKTFARTFFTNWTAGGLITLNITPNNFSTSGNTINFNQTRPPSHKTLLVELLNSTNTVVGSLLFDSIYTRNSSGNNPTDIVTGTQFLSSTDTDHKLVYDYSGGVWRLQFKLGSGVVTNIVNVRISFKIGLYNIVNSIVPTLGLNTGSAGTAIDRFPDSSGIDYYPITSLTYNDSDTSFIDDYSATFSIVMAQNQGNGLSGLKVNYTEAFLFNESNDLFSIIRFPYPAIEGETKVGFEKTSDLSYLISWTIKSII